MRPTCRSGRSSRTSPTVDLQRSSTRSAEHELDLFRTEITRVERHRRLAARAPERQRPACCGLPAQRPDRRDGCSKGAPASGCRSAPTRTAAWCELLARYAAPSDRQAADPVHAPARSSASPTSCVADIDDGAAHVAGADGQRHDPLVAVRRDRRGRHSRHRRDPARRDLRHRHRLPSRAARGATLLGRLRGAHRRRRADHLGPGDRPRARGRVRQRAARRYSAMWFKDGDGKGAYYGLDGQSKQRSFLASPLEFSRVTSGFAMRMHPILNTWKQHNGRRLRRAHRHAGAHRRRRRGRVRRLAERLRQRHPDPAQRNERSTVYAHLSRIDVRHGPARRAGRATSAPSARPAGRPARTCTSSSRSTACSRIRCRSRKAPRRSRSRRRSARRAFAPARAARARPARRRRDTAAHAAARR